MMRGALSPLVAIAILTCGPALAADTFAFPQGCDAFLTAQSHSCLVEHYFTCEGDLEGVTRCVDLGGNGLNALGSTDRDAQSLPSFSPCTDNREQLEAAPADPASLTELLAKGVDTYDFQTLSDEIGTARFKGQDRLTGQIITKDDVALQQTAYQLTAYVPEVTELWSAAGNEFVNANWRRFTVGTSTVTAPDDSFDKDDRPVQFIFPGEPGFLSATPKFDCGVALSPASVLTPKEISNDHL
jgi:hypothetical protein